MYNKMAQLPDFAYMSADDAITADEFIEPPATFKSVVWKYFKLSKSRKLSICNVCNTVMSFSGNTTNLQTHLRRHHPHIEISLGQGNSGISSPSSSSSSVYIPKSSPVPVSPIFSNVESGSNDSFGSLTINKLVPVGVSSKSWVTTDAIAKYLISDLRRFSVIDDAGFRNMIHTLDPTYVLPSVQHFMETEIPRLYHHVKSNVKEMVYSADRVALSSDIWTSSSNQNQVTVTCHYIDNEWQVKSNVLQTAVLPECYTGQDVGDILHQIVRDWDLRDHHPAVVTDEEIQLYPPLSEQQLNPHHVCFAQTLNAASQKGLDCVDVKNLLKKVRRVLSFFYRNETAMTLLKQRQAMVDVPQNKLKLDVHGRSNSTYNMLERFLEQKSAVCATLASKELRKEAMNVVMLTENENAEVESLIELLKPVKMATQAICEKDKPTVSVVAPLLSQLKGMMQTKQGDSQLIRVVKSAILEHLQSCHTGEGEMEFLHIASALDPRFKSLPFLSDIQRLSAFSSLAVKATNLHKTRQTQHKPETLSSQSVRQTDHFSHSPSKFPSDICIKQEPSESGPGVTMVIELNDKSEWDEPPAKRSALSSLFGDVFVEQSHQPKSVLTSAQEEVDRYKTENPTSLDRNPLLWWKDHEGAYPLLSALAKSVLCIPGATISSEKVFSHSGDIVNIQRKALKCSSVDMMLFLKKNMEFP